MGLDRRAFLELLGAALAATATGCAAVMVTRITPTAGALRLPIRNYPQLARPGGYLKVQPDGGTTPIYVLAMEESGYVALSPICTHLGCTVNIEGARLVCPCHGSTYDRAGRVLRGPAERSLTQFPTSVTRDGELVIQLEARA